MKKLALILALVSTILIMSSPSFAAERESFYSDLICETVYSGNTDSLPSGLRPDCQTEFVIMEFDWATRTKLYECIGQSLVYAVEAVKYPVCVLLARNDEELAFGLSQDLAPMGIKLVVFDTRPYDP